MWTGKVPSLVNIKVWGCEDFVRRETHEKLEPRSKRCILIGYPHKSFGYTFYKPSENVVFVVQRGVFRERELIFKMTVGVKLTLKRFRSQPVKEP